MDAHRRINALTHCEYRKVFNATTIMNRKINWNDFPRNCRLFNGDYSCVVYAVVTSLCFSRSSEPNQ